MWSRARFNVYIVTRLLKQAARRLLRKPIKMQDVPKNYKQVRAKINNHEKFSETRSIPIQRAIFPAKIK